MRTRVGGQTDGPRGGGHRHAVVEPQQRQVVLKVQVAELAQDGPQDKPGLGFPGGVAIVVFAERDFDQRPYEPDTVIEFDYARILLAHG